MLSPLQYASSSPLQPGRHWVADSLSASRESHPLRGSLRAVSGSTIIILAVMAYIGSCPMVSDGILAQPLLFQEGHRVPHRWLSPGLMSQCLLIQFSRFRGGLCKKPFYYICGLDPLFLRAIWGGTKENFLLSLDDDSKAFFRPFRILFWKDPSTIYVLGEPKKCPPECPILKVSVILSYYADRNGHFRCAFVILRIRSSIASVYFPSAISRLRS